MCGCQDKHNEASVAYGGTRKHRVVTDAAIGSCISNVITCAHKPTPLSSTAMLTVPTAANTPRHLN
eukprot:5065544-Amphidinium_carterae.1